MGWGALRIIGKVFQKEENILVILTSDLINYLYFSMSPSGVHLCKCPVPAPGSTFWSWLDPSLVTLHITPSIDQCVAEGPSSLGTGFSLLLSVSGRGGWVLVQPSEFRIRTSSF